MEWVTTWLELFSTNPIGAIAQLAFGLVIVAWIVSIAWRMIVGFFKDSY